MDHIHQRASPLRLPLPRPTLRADLIPRKQRGHDGDEFDLRELARDADARAVGPGDVGAGGGGDEVFFFFAA